jgi:hypothetical protein
MQSTTTTKRDTPETADPAIQPPAKRQRRGKVQHHVRVPGCFVPPSNPETVMWSQMRAIGLRSDDVERLINRRVISESEMAYINRRIAECTDREAYPSGYEFDLLVRVAELFIHELPVEDPEPDCTAKEKQRYLVKLGFPATFVKALFQALPSMHIEHSDAIELAYDFACVGARLHCMEHDGVLRRGWFDDAIADPSLFSQLDPRALSDVPLLSGAQ